MENGIEISSEENEEDDERESNGEEIPFIENEIANRALQVEVMILLVDLKGGRAWRFRDCFILMNQMTAIFFIVGRLSVHYW